MKNLIVKVFVFMVPILSWFIIEGFLPLNTYTYRTWEALSFQTAFGFGKIFYPNTKLEMESAGQLCYNTKNAILQNEIWITDKLGNRNDTFIEYPDILIIGDSNIVGSSATQDSTITNQLKSELGNQSKIYNISPGDFSILDYYLKAKLINKPRMIIFSRGERYIPGPIVKYPERELQSLKTRLITTLNTNSAFLDLTTFMDKFLRRYSINWLKARLSGQKGDGIPGIKGSNMYFLDTAYLANETYVVHKLSDVEQTINNIVSYKHYCDSLGIEFLFLPVPNKETVYYDYIPLELQPDEYLLKLDSLLKVNNIPTINILKLFNDYRQSHTSLLYHLDDTHWNSNGIRIVVKEVSRIIKQSQKYIEKN